MTTFLATVAVVLAASVVISAAVLAVAIVVNRREGMAALREWRDAQGRTRRPSEPAAVDELDELRGLR